MRSAPNAEDEYRRLLYVAVTRASDRLYVCGTEKQVGDRDKPKRWHALVTVGARRRNASPPTRTTAASRWSGGRRAAVAAAEGEPGGDDAVRRSCPIGFAGLRRRRRRRSAGSRPRRCSAATVEPARRLSPRFDAGKQARGARADRSTGCSQSLPDMPPERRAEIGARYLAAVASGDAGRGTGSSLATSSRSSPIRPSRRCSPPGSRAEVDIAGRFGEGRPCRGRIDRLAVTDDRVLIVDYKTNRPAPSDLGGNAPRLRRAAGALPQRARDALSRKISGCCDSVDRPSRADADPIGIAQIL